MTLRILFRFFGVILLLLVIWASLWAGFENLNIFAAIGRTKWLPITVYVTLNYALVAIGIWMLRGGPQFIRMQK